MDVSNLITVRFYILLSRNSHEMISASPTRTNGRMDTSDHGMLSLSKVPGAIENGFTGIKITSVKCLFIFNWSFKCSNR